MHIFHTEENFKLMVDGESASPEISLHTQCLDFFITER